jgi:hypothetical protein
MRFEDIFKCEKEFYQKTMTPKMLDFFSNVPKVLQKITDALAINVTFTHGDAWLFNFLFDVRLVYKLAYPRRCLQMQSLPQF